MKNTKRIVLFVGCALLLLKPLTSTAQYVYTDSSLQKQLNEARRDVCNEQFPDAIVKYAALVKNNDNKTVSAEYAYALALTGCYDGAIMNLDKILASGQADKDVLFYTSQVFRLMEYDSIAHLFWSFSYDKKSFAPSWISGQYLSFAEKYKCRATINIDDLGTALQRANKLANHHQFIQSMILFLELTETYPDQYLPCIGLSALLENLGFKKAAIEYLQKGIEKMGKEKLKIDPLGAYDKHLEKLKSENAIEHNSSILLANSKDVSVQADTRKSFIYTGLSYVNKSLAFNVMYGIYTSPTTNFSVNLGYSRFDDVSTLVGDVSINLKIDKYELIGATISTQYSNGFDVGLGARVGWSIPISGGNSSFDILYNVYYYFRNKEMRTTLSVGFTRYF